jgi:hypothetical protein
VLQEADLIEAEKIGRTIVYRLKMSVVEDALLGFVQTLGLKTRSPRRSRDFPASRADRRLIKGEA